MVTKGLDNICFGDKPLGRVMFGQYVQDIQAIVT